jgi:hypothetical protein
MRSVQGRYKVDNLTTILGNEKSRCEENKMNKPRRMLFVVFTLLCTSGVCFGQQKGGVPIRIPDAPAPQCINGSTDQVWLTMYRVITMKKNGFFSRENQAEIIVKVQVKTQPQSTPALSYPLSTTVNIREYQTGQVSIPVEYTLVSGLGLKTADDNKKDVLYTGFGVDTTLVNLRSKNGLGSALQALADITGSNKLPIPDSPYKQAAGYLLDFANKAVTNDINTKNQDDKYSTASLALNFDPEGSCTGTGPGGQGFETTGTKAILMADGIPGDSLVPIDQTADYCWVADLTPSFAVKVAKKVGSTPCTDAIYAPKYKAVTNDYVAFFLQKRKMPGHLGADKIAARDLKESKTLCDLLGVPTCPAAEK